MRLNDDNKTVRAMDILFPGIGEIVGGSQREERADVLKKRMREIGVDEEELWWYNDLRIFDLTVGDELYKKKWSNRISPIYEHISAVSFSGNIYLLAKRVKEYIKTTPVIGSVVKRIYNFFR